MKEKNKKTLILGGGFSGLALARYLGDGSVVLEAEETAGGLCRSFQKNGFTYDIGGHILFSKDAALLKEITGWLGENVARKRRKNEIWYGDRYLKYPFENGIAGLDREEREECLKSFLDRSLELRPRNLEEWFRFRFGEAISKKYLIPYNRKIWKRDLKKMSTLWVDRVPDPPEEDIVKAARGIETEGYLHQLNFFYPREGGIDALVGSLLSAVADLRTGFRVSSVEKRGSGWVVSDGSETFFGERIVSTIPILDLIASLEKVPEKVEGALSRLQYNSLLLVMVGVKHEGLVKRTALYIPDPEILTHRVCFMKYFSENNAPVGRSHLTAEIAVPPGDPLLEMEDGLLIERVVGEIKEICGFAENEVAAVDLKKIKYAYVVYDQAYSENTRIIYDYLDSLGMYYAGRFGSFRYINMDACVAEAKALAKRLKER